MSDIGLNMKNMISRHTKWYHNTDYKYLTPDIVNKCEKIVYILNVIRYYNEIVSWHEIKKTKKIIINFTPFEIQIYIHNKELKPEDIYNDKKFKSSFKYLYQKKQNIYTFHYDDKKNEPYGIIFCNNLELKFIKLYSRDNELQYNAPIFVNNSNYTKYIRTVGNNIPEGLNGLMIVLPNIYRCEDRYNHILKIIKYNLSILFMEDIYFKDLKLYIDYENIILDTPLMPHNLDIPRFPDKSNKKEVLSSYYYKKRILKSFKDDILWDQRILIKRKMKHLYRGNNILCPCCHRDIDWNGYPHCGHIKAEKKGGKSDSHNLLYICSKCNRKMGTNNMLTWTYKRINHFKTKMNNYDYWYQKEHDYCYKEQYEEYKNL